MGLIIYCYTTLCKACCIVIYKFYIIFIYYLEDIRWKGLLLAVDAI